MPAWKAAFRHNGGGNFFRGINKKITISTRAGLLSAQADIARFLLFNSFGLIQNGEFLLGATT
ncbi:hypothetical protein B194_5098 [Serratia plymuthica A30]|nr:hypothetical protein B194_5098 [Serratia plymuthica A30]